MISNFQCYSVLKFTFLSVMMQPGPCGQIIRSAKKHMQVWQDDAEVLYKVCGREIG
jgi:hypothetical protein